MQHAIDPGVGWDGDVTWSAISRLASHRVGEPQFSGIYETASRRSRSSETLVIADWWD